MAYSDKVIDHYENPRNVGKLDDSSKNVGTGIVGAPACGDVMRLQIQVDDQGVIEDAKFKTYGCGSAIASSSLLTEWVKGKHIDDAEAIKNTEIAEELALPPVKIHCSVLAEDAIKAAVRDIREKQGELIDGMAITMTPAAEQHVIKHLEHRAKGVGIRLVFVPLVAPGSPTCSSLSTAQRLMTRFSNVVTSNWLSIPKALSTWMVQSSTTLKRVLTKALNSRTPM